MAFIEWAWWPGRITGDDKDCPARLKLIKNRSLKIELGRIPLILTGDVITYGKAWPVGGGAGRQMNEFIVVSIGFQMNESKPSQFNDSRNESLKIRVSQSWLPAAIV